MPPNFYFDADAIHELADRIHDEYAATNARPFPQSPHVYWRSDDPNLLQGCIYNVLEDFRGGGRALGHEIDTFVEQLKKYADEIRLGDQQAADGLANIYFHGDGSTPGGFK